MKGPMMQESLLSRQLCVFRGPGNCSSSYTIPVLAEQQGRDSGRCVEPFQATKMRVACYAASHISVFTRFENCLVV